MPVLVGTSGWHYAHWRPQFYPASMGPAHWLEYYSERFAAVEVNNAFYRLPERSTFERWRDIVPSDFVVAVKASRYLTHVKRLKDPEEPVARLLDRCTALGPRLGPILLQLPPNLKVDPQQLDRTLAAFSGAVRLAVEPRHPSWFTKEVRTVLEKRAAALCLADGGPVETPMWRTTDWTYARFHAGKGRPQSCYLRRELEAWIDRWAEQLSDAEDTYCFFNNDLHGCALRDARWFAAACRRIDRRVSRVPAPRETRLRRE